MTLGYQGRQLRALEDRITILETNGIWRGDERRSDALFSDAQVEWLKMFYEDRDDIKAGRALYRLLFYVACAAAVGAGSVLIAYFKLTSG